MNEFKGMTNQESLDFQLSEWVKGNPLHNTIRNECCPDFSCCSLEILQPKEIRETFAAANDKDRMGMLFSFLSGMVATEVPDKKIHIVDGNTEITKDLN